MEIRLAGSDDALAIEAVRLAGWQQGYRGIVADSFLDRLEADPRRRAEMIFTPGVTTIVADLGRVAGMAVVGPSRDEDLSCLELYALYVDPSVWRRGIGGALLTACPHAGSVWVLEANERARGLYAHHGFAPDGAAKVLDLDGPVTEIRMRRSLG